MQGVALKQSSETFRFQVSLAIPESQLVAWFEQAAHRDRIIYCHGYVPLREDAAWKLAGAWAREGLVHLVTEKDGGQTRWIAERSSAGPKAAKAPRDRSDDVTTIQLRKLLDHLRGAADRGEAMPGYRWLARDLTGNAERKGRDRVAYLLKRLAEQGRITLTPAPKGAQHGPTVTIAAKGRGFGKSCTALGRQGGK